MSHFIHNITDFLASKNGKIVVAAASILCGIIWVGLPSKKNASIESEQGADSEPELWASSTTDSTPPIQQVDTNESFELFKPAKPKAEPAVAPQAEPPNPKPITETTIKIPLPREVPQIHEPLFKEEHEVVSRDTAPQKLLERPTLPALETGAVIHCQLIAPVSADQNGAPVIAHVTRPLIRDGIPIIPRGSRLFGKVQTSNDGRMFFEPEWITRDSAGKEITISAFARQKGDGVLHNRSGVPGTTEGRSENSDIGKITLGNVVKGIAALGKDTVRTGIGELVPGTARNTLINGGIQVVDTLLPPQKEQKKHTEPNLIVPAGREFTLVVSSTTRDKVDKPTSSQNIDLLLEQMLRKQLER